VPASKREGREWTGKRPKGKEGVGKGKGGREEERREGRGRKTCIPHYF